MTAAVLGHEGLRAKVWGFEVRDYAFYFAAGMELLSAGIFIATTLTTEHDILDKQERGDKQLSRASLFLNFLPAVQLTIVSLLWSRAWGHHLFHSFPALLIVTVTIHWCFITTKILVSHMTKQPIPVARICLFLLPISLATLNSNQLFIRLENEIFVVWSLFFFSFFVYVSYVVKVVQDSCKYLGIYCFSIRAKD
eukprot:c8691_g1_i1.p1 GENE.c8691_g1_i1~~c8691_g1_i1.p1  ORF type:complete len:195 (+),score=39.34 c8691_g1_i1:928-1512(+)